MVIGNRLKELRESKQLSQGDIEKRTGEDAVYLSKLCRLLATMKPNDQQFLLHMAQKAARGSNRSAD
jgi:transcriptional regulator with XRE-family HTH domain